MSYGAYGYLSVIEAVGLKTVVSRDLDEDYQGSVAAVVQLDRYQDGVDETRPFWYMTIGYGSCSGCDGWEATEYDPLGRLEDTASIVREARHFENLEQLQKFVAEFDHETQWYGRSGGLAKFQADVAAIQDGDDFKTRED